MNIEHQQHFHSSLPLPIRHQYGNLCNVEAVLKSFCDGFSEASLARGSVTAGREEIGSIREHVSGHGVRRQKLDTGHLGEGGDLKLMFEEG